jgi:hypothetical protein
MSFIFRICARSLMGSHTLSRLRIHLPRRCICGHPSLCYHLLALLQALLHNITNYNTYTHHANHLIPAPVAHQLVSARHPRRNVCKPRCHPCLIVGVHRCRKLPQSLMCKGQIKHRADVSCDMLHAEIRVRTASSSNTSLSLHTAAANVG